MTFGEKIQRLRKEKGFSQEDIAEKLSVTRQTVSKWELDQSTPDLEYIAKLCDIFETSAEYLIRQQEPEKELPDKTPPAEQKTAVFIPADNRVKYSSLFILGLLFTGIGMIGILVFVFLSAMNPWGAQVGKYYFEGLLAFLIGTDSLGWFILLCIIGIGGLICAVIGIFKKDRLKK